ncbi:MAG: galactokinase, partial [Gemmatimonadaceae bacterium]|nr:galactokinase [Gemmatimonadaceae bacterium]
MERGHAVSASAAHELFLRRFGRRPAVIASAPGRVNLIGEHIDYNGGEVLPIAIACRTAVAVAPAPAGRRSTVVSAGQWREGELSVREVARAEQWWDYVAGVARELVRAGVPLPDVDVAVWSDVPTGAGLSSSAALEVASALALLAVVPHAMALRDVALLGARAEREFVGVASGVMDQYASALGRAGHALHVWCDSGDVEHVPADEAVLIFDTGVPRGLRASAFNERRAECDAALARLRRVARSLPNLAAARAEHVEAAHLPPPLDRRVRHVLSENARVQRAVEALRRDGRLPGALLTASHESLRADYECSTPELDWFVEHATACSGVTGAPVSYTQLRAHETPRQVV